MKKYMLCMLLTCLFCYVKAQTSERRNNITIFGGLPQYAGDHGNGFFVFNDKVLDNNRALGASIGFYLSPSFDIMVLGTYGTISFYKDDFRHFKSYMTTGSINLKYKFGIADESTLKPYIFLGTGAVNHYNNNEPPIDPNTGLHSTVDGLSWLAVSTGAGLTVQLSDLVSLQYQLSYGYWNRDDHDFLEAGAYNDAHIINSLGIGFNLGKVSDSDGDGVPDKKDKCANTPAGSKVDKDGCPFDSDNDGVLDHMDKCPDIAGSVKTNGCPDKDGDDVADADDECPEIAGKADLKGCPDRDEDGIADAKDKCPDQRGVAMFEGCPDTDGDSIPDAQDRCPSVKGLIVFGGCPDTDGDGIQDSADMCPTVKGPASSKGCPDTDADGVHDGIDKCPTISGTAANNGCPELQKEVKALFQKALQGIQFETGKATIKPVSYPILNSIVKVMNDNPSYKLLIGGHTDNVGDDASNMTLSQNRADAVSKYLIEKGVSPMRVSATGYGETQPVDTNKTPAGKARNRRVELSVEFLDTIK